jgi:Ca2+-binding RTX toxin-like protein
MASNKRSGDTGADVLDDGADNDTVSYLFSASRVKVKLLGSGSGGDAEGDTLIDIENLFGSDHNDNLFGDTGDNHLQGHGGNDYLHGDDGNDVLNGGGETRLRRQDRPGRSGLGFGPQKSLQRRKLS